MSAPSPENRAVLDRSAGPPDATVAYGPAPEQVADLRLPPGDEPAPLVLLWHGGFWLPEWDRHHAAPMAEALAAAGYAVASLEYRRTGSGGWPATAADVAAGADRVPGLVTAAAPGRVDLDRVVFAAHSAGGHVAVWAAQRAAVGEPAATTPVGVLALAPVLDLVATHRHGDPVADLLGGSPEQVPEAYAAADPSARGPVGVPLTVVHGLEDSRVPVESSRSWTRAHGDRLVEVPGADHFAVIDPESAAWPVVLHELATLATR
ncbi:alpha/beta hydrolase family protein [Motilibacter peucedani]|uniref:Alpha/beta hydrolase family protein n=1 Tax=Motilibacter peucedani TaxID=598650 RepID=A0A420XKV4_9ACTN|nr:alpha/beta hydrolase fold domain-containing protein [Motilibacter peucedani]RKS68538.1 alpha/beta hydrolase family protein [Motilibacter peucedani]